MIISITKNSDHTKQQLFSIENSKNIDVNDTRLFMQYQFIRKSCSNGIETRGAESKYKTFPRLNKQITGLGTVVLMVVLC